jgi:cytochrome oxidase Cu insertion factor (SCO1/SenC/PrrC family)
MTLKTLLLAGALALPVLPPAYAQAQDAAKAKPAGEAAAQPGGATPPLAKPKRDPQAYFTDLELLTQDGQKVRFYSDVLKGRMVVINTIFTNCKDACPLITEQMNKVRAQLGDIFGKEIYFISISSDPLRDTPKAMKKFAAKNKADVPGWIWLTGSKENVAHILKKLGQWSEQVEAHSTVLVAWNFNTDKGRKLMPNIPPEALAAQLKMLAGYDALPGFPAKLN